MRIVSLQSGTSADGIDVAVVDVEVADDPGGAPADVSSVAGGSRLALTPVLTRTVDWERALRARILGAALGDVLDAGAWCRLDTALGQAFADAAADVVAEAGPADLIVSHGQTLHHWVEGGRARGTLQLGDPSWIAERAGAPVLSHVRAADIAAGGEGAPLMAVFDRLWLGEEARAAGRALATVNLGGIANVQIVAPSGEVCAFDSGPANALVDEAVSEATAGAEAFDRDGRHAGAGHVHDVLLARLLAHPYFAAAAPKTTGRETFHLGVVGEAARAVGADAVGVDDLAATLTELTAITVVGAFAPEAAPAELVVSGGGALNPVLLDRLAAHARARGIRVASSAERGLDPAFKESLMFALLGFLSWHGVPVRIAGPAMRVAGRISPGPSPLRLPEPIAGATSLTIHQENHR
ncbi:anhydro-N-acetylmuramic acid kinase [Agromyces protaetiae]|uniref:Anhydro-N-acetylmuramic acid kinase n=1 Tax=Agromyces protaetiae TaxID=2509455 RepID=A0A4P6FF49_9MICO|nr:anhydro-N-acetylmuramic acid kinase [Agromyces protaetiae]QAY73019.1 anhydro-N-acetylmuramic acid kinase [Agromyces protaetiae]